MTKTLESYAMNCGEKFKTMIVHRQAIYPTFQAKVTPQNKLMIVRKIDYKTSSLIQIVTKKKMKKRIVKKARNLIAKVN